MEAANESELESEEDVAAIHIMCMLCVAADAHGVDIDNISQNIVNNAVGACEMKIGKFAQICAVYECLITKLSYDASITRK